MSRVRLLAVILGHIAFAGASYAVWVMGRNFAPEEFMMSEVVIYPLIIGVVGIWIWYGFWSYGALKAGDAVTK